MEVLKQALVALEDARVRMQSAYVEAPDEILTEALAELAAVREKTVERVSRDTCKKVPQGLCQLILSTYDLK